MRATAENEGRSAAGINSEPIQRSALSRTAEPPPYYSCPATYESPPVLVRDNSTVNLKRSAPDSLCTLVRVTFAAPNDDEEEFVRQDQVGRNILAPAGRSYHSLPWERVAGPYRSSVHYDCGHDDEDDNREMLHVCQVTLPPLGSNQAFVLLTYNRTLSQRNTVARFLQQTTFGPTKEEVESWDYSAGDDAFATWTQEQMYTVPLTSHREFWRRRVRQRFDRAAPVGRPAHPCESNSRWREVAFTEWDVGSTVTMRPLVASANGVNAPYILYIDGQLRTIAPNFRFSEASYGIDISHGYEVCQMPQARVGGQLILRQPDGSCRDVYGGNMRVMLDDNVITTTPDIVVLDLPSFGGTNNSLTRDDERAGFIFARGIQDQIEKCDGIPISGSVAPVFGRVPSTIPGEAGAFLLHDPHLVLSDNSPDSPLSDGGGELSQATGGVMMCSNAPPSFLNAEGCQLSDEPMACTADDSNAPSIELTLNPETVVQLSKLSGRYIYVVDGLRVEVGDVLSPCVEGSMSRWMRTDKTQLLCGGDVVLASGTISVLSDLLSTSRDENSFLRDVHFPEDSERSCHASDIGAIGMELFVDGTCFRHVHPDHFNVHDFTYWSGEKAHPGNAIRKLANLPNPIKAFLDIASSSILYFPSHHTMDRWSTFKPDFHYVGRFGDIINFRDLSDSLRIRAVAEGFGAVSEADKEVPKLVCGSHGEVSNELSRVMEGFDVSFDREIDIYTDSYYVQQRKTAWTSVVLNSQDQLRQRVAWALSQILVVTTFDIEAKRNTEMFLSFYDIFARNAFGSYSEILKEVIYSPLMGEMLTYLESKSSAFVWEEEKRRVFADENMAREVLQLFTTGLVHLNVDGTPKLDADGGTIPVYNQEDILSYARGWTGFRRRRKRSNTEGMCLSSFARCVQ